MKFLFAFFSLCVVAFLEVEAFSFNSRESNRRSRSSLSMNVEVNADGKTIKVGVIGMGRIGLVHLEAITKAPGVVPVIVSNPTVSKAEAGEFITLKLGR
jgi:myo-inositol 2-dehydrogenase / D-chiro-inositol 1-dehydrogenase